MRRKASIYPGRNAPDLLRLHAQGESGMQLAQLEAHASGALPPSPALSHAGPHANGGPAAGLQGYLAPQQQQSTPMSVMPEAIQAMQYTASCQPVRESSGDTEGSQVCCLQYARRNEGPRHDCAVLFI